MYPPHHLAPQHAGDHDVGFFHRRHLVAAQARQFKGDAGDALDLVLVIDLGIDGALFARGQGDEFLGLTEIDPAGQFAHDHDVETGHHLGLQGRGVFQRVETQSRTQIGEQAEIAAQTQQRPFRLQVERQRIPLRTADGAEQHRVGLKRFGHHRVGGGHAVGLVGHAADQIVVGDDFQPALGGVPAEHAAGLFHDFGADPVAGQQKNSISAHVTSRAFGFCAGSRRRRYRLRGARSDRCRPSR